MTSYPVQAIVFHMTKRERWNCRNTKGLYIGCSLMINRGHVVYLSSSGRYVPASVKSGVDATDNSLKTIQELIVTALDHVEQEKRRILQGYLVLGL